jgi:hypothetical protein
MTIDHANFCSAISESMTLVCGKRLLHFCTDTSFYFLMTFLVNIDSVAALLTLRHYSFQKDSPLLVSIHASLVDCCMELAVPIKLSTKFSNKVPFSPSF